MTLSVTVERFFAIAYPLQRMNLKNGLIFFSVFTTMAYNVPRFFELKTSHVIVGMDLETGVNITVIRIFNMHIFHSFIIMLIFMWPEKEMINIFRGDNFIQKLGLFILFGNHVTKKFLMCLCKNLVINATPKRNTRVFWLFFYLMCGCLPCGRICSKCKPLLGYWKIDYKRIEKNFLKKRKKNIDEGNFSDKPKCSH